MAQEGLQQDWQNMCGSSTDVGERENASRDEVLSWKGVDTVEREWIRFRETDIEVIGEYVASRSMNYGESGR